MAAARKRTAATPFVCEKCGRGEKGGKKHRGHGLCGTCHQRLWKDGTLKEWIAKRGEYHAPPPPSGTPAVEEGKSVVVVMDSPIPAPPAGITLDSPPPKEKTADGRTSGKRTIHDLREIGRKRQSEAMSNEPPMADADDPTPITLQWLSKRDRRLLEILDLMSLTHRRPLLQEVYSILENSADDFLRYNPIFQDRGNMLKCKEEMT